MYLILTDGYMPVSQTINFGVTVNSSVFLPIQLISQSWDFPGDPVVKNPPSNAGDAGSIPGRGTSISHAAGQLSPRSTTTELMRLNQSLHVANYRAHTPWSLRATTREEKTRTPQLERSPRTTTKDPAYLGEDPACLN